MIENVSIKNFKSHNNTKLSLKNLTLLTGMNGMGKSSIIQALLLLRQSHKKGMLERGLELKGELCDIGTAKDALYQSADDDTIAIHLVESEGINLNYDFLFEDSRIDDTFIKRVGLVENTTDTCNLFTDNFQYISAFRNGPMKDYDRDTSQVEFFRQLSRIEGRCEFTAHYLFYYGDNSISSESLMFDTATGMKLHDNVEKWMSAISPDIQIFVQAIESSFRLNYRFGRGKDQTPTEQFRATNIGFGISYVLPIIIAALHAPQGSVVIIENPEAHIHPAGQAKLMELISRSAKAGVQFIIETHSDHIINGVLVGVKENLITTNDLSVYFIDRDQRTHATDYQELPILKGGRIKKPPKGFFDQIDIDMKKLIGF